MLLHGHEPAWRCMNEAYTRVYKSRGLSLLWKVYFIKSHGHQYTQAHLLCESTPFALSRITNYTYTLPTHYTTTQPCTGCLGLCFGLNTSKQPTKPKYPDYLTRTRASRSTGTAIYLEKERNPRHNRRRTWSLPTRPGDASETSTISDRGDTQHLQLHRVESCQAYPQLRCIRCGGVRSRDYHYRHFDDPAKYPSVGICSRERTRCAWAKSNPEPELLKMADTRAVVQAGPGTGMETGNRVVTTGARIETVSRAVQAPLLDIHELPDTSTDTMDTKSCC